MATNGNGRSDSGRQKVKNLMLKCLPSLKAFALSLSQNETRAEDLVQQTVLQALSNLDSFQPGTNMSAWLFTILRNRFMSDYRKLRREKEWNPKFEDALFFSTGMGEGSAEAAFDFNRILLYLACLPVDQADALIAVGYLGMSYEESAERLSTVVGTVKSRVNRARIELLRFIDETAVKQVDLVKLKTAAQGVPQSHPYHPIAKAYEELYAASQGVSNGSNGNGKHHPEESAPVSESEKAWKELVASGALDDNENDLTALMQSDQDEL